MLRAFLLCLCACCCGPSKVLPIATRKIEDAGHWPLVSPVQLVERVSELATGHLSFGVSNERWQQGIKKDGDFDSVG